MYDTNDYENGIIIIRDFRELESCGWKIVKILKDRVKVMNISGDYNYLKIGDTILNKEEVEHHKKVIHKHKKR